MILAGYWRLLSGGQTAGARGYFPLVLWVPAAWFPPPWASALLTHFLIICFPILRQSPDVLPDFYIDAVFCLDR